MKNSLLGSNCIVFNCAYGTRTLNKIKERKIIQNIKNDLFLKRGFF